ncbi:hypothetical protein BGW80DRAFT_251520 [Lactifluus volemus]|nr:hypothetical protein BGW80DRAFT_251520 [Lactifluus volemus]
MPKMEIHCVFIPTPSRPTHLLLRSSRFLKFRCLAPFPIEMRCFSFRHKLNVALEHRDRIRGLHLLLGSSEWGKLAKMSQIQKPFPALTRLRLRLGGQSGPVPELPVTLLGGSAPSLRSFQLDGIPFPTLPRLLLSCKDLSELSLRWIPNLGYISPEAMVTVLSALIKLTYFEIGFKQLETGQIRLAPPPPPTRALLPSLRVFKFRDEGVKEYSEDLLARMTFLNSKHFR